MKDYYILQEVSNFVANVGEDKSENKGLAIKIICYWLFHI